MKKLKIGVVGVGRGGSMMRYCAAAENAELVAVCDNWVEGLRQKEQELKDENITFYESYDEFLNHDMDVVVLANYATEHVPFALKAFEKGLHVFTEVLPCQTMQEAVQLVEAVERTGLKYAYLENTCYMAGPREMKKLYKQGVLGEFEYGEGEYCHSIWFSLYGSKGRMETAREDAEMGHAGRLYLNVDKTPGVYDDADNHVAVNYLPQDQMSKKAKKFSHQGADFYTMWNAVEYVLDNPEADPIDVYEAMDMFLPGLFAHFSLLAGGTPVEVPDLRDPAQREKYRNDTRCTDPKVAGAMLIPQTAQQTEEIPMEVYERIQAKWQEIAPK